MPLPAFVLSRSHWAVESSSSLWGALADLRGPRALISGENVRVNEQQGVLLVGQLEASTRSFLGAVVVWVPQGPPWGLKTFPPRLARGSMRRKRRCVPTPWTRTWAPPSLNRRTPRGPGVQKAARSPPRSLTHLLAPTRSPTSLRPGAPGCVLCRTHALLCARLSLLPAL